MKVGSAWGRFPVGVTHWQELGRRRGRYRGATGVQLSRPEAAISGFKTTKRGTERVDLEELHSAIKCREVCSLSLLTQSFQRSRRKVNAKMKGNGEGTMWPLWTVASIVIAKQSEKKRNINRIKGLRITSVNRILLLCNLK